MYLFKLQCEKSDKILREKLELKTVCDEFKVNVSETAQLKSEEVLMEEENIIIEEKSMEGNEKVDENTLLDELENIDFQSLDNDSEADISTKENETQAHVKIKEFHCEVCQKQFSRNDLLLRHKIAHAIKMEDSKSEDFKKVDRTPVIYSEIDLKTEEFLYSCNHCDLLYVHKEDLENHFNQTHGIKQEFNVACHICSEKFSKMSHKNRHLKKVHFLDKQYKCPTCCKSFSKKEQLEHHVNTHLGKKPHTCSICLKGYQLLVAFNNRLKFYLIKYLVMKDQFPLICCKI